MENKSFSQASDLHKRNKLAKVILAKNKNVSTKNIEKILQCIDLNEQYFVKVVSSRAKFQNIVVNEQIEDETRKEASKISYIYGDFTPGTFIKKNGSRTLLPCRLNSLLSAAALKYHTIFHPVLRTTCTLVIYQPSVN